MPTKEEMLNTISELPLGVVERLYNYSQRLIIPDERMLSSVTMQQMVEEANSIADEVFPEWTDRSKSDFGMFLVELMALFSEKDFWYVNALANESLLLRMRSYSRAFIRAVELGHSPTVLNSASGTFDVTFDASVTGTDYAPGQLILQNEAGQQFSNITDFNVPSSVGSYVKSVTLHEGTFVSDTFSFNGYGIPIRRQNVAINTIRIFLDGVEWTRVKVFGQSSSTNEHYMVLPEDDGTCTIFFGTGGYGKTPALGSSFVVSFMVTNGSEGNVAPSTLTVQKFLAGRTILGQVQNATLTGGEDQETLDSMKQTTLNYFTGKNSCFNAATTEKFLNSQPEIIKSRVRILGNIVMFYVQPKDGTVASGGLLTDLETRLDKYIVNGFVASGNATSYVNASPISATFYYLQGYDSAAIITEGKQLISDYTNPVVFAEYGADFDLSQLSVLLISKIAGLQNVVFNTVAGVPAANVVVGNTAILNKVSTANITITAIAVS